MNVNQITQETLELMKSRTKRNGEPLNKKILPADQLLPQACKIYDLQVPSSKYPVVDPLQPYPRGGGCTIGS